VGRKWIAVILFVLVTGLAVLIYFIQKGSKSILSDPYDAIPKDASLIIESVNLPELFNVFTSGNGLFREISSIKELAQFNTKIKILTDLINRKDCRTLFENNKALISFHVMQGGKVVPLLSMNVPSDFRMRHARAVIDSAAGVNFKEIKFGKSRITMLPYGNVNERDTVYMALVSGLFSCTSSLHLLKTVIQQIDLKEDVRSVPGFVRIMGASGKKEDKVSLIFPNFPVLVQSLFSEGSKWLPAKFGKVAASAEGDIFINANGIILSGYAEATDSSQYMYKYKESQSGHFDTYKVLPSSTVLFETLLMPGKISGNNKTETVSDSTLSLAIALRPYVGEEITRAIIDIKENSPKMNSLIVFELRNRDMAERIMTQKIGSWASRKNLKDNEYIKYFQPDDQVKIPVYSTPFRMLVSNYVNGFSSSEEDSLFAFYDNYMICGNSYATISRFLYDNILNKTLFNDQVYRDFETTLPSRACYYFYCVPSGIIDYLSDYLNDKIINILKTNIVSLKKIQAAGYQFIPSNGMIYNTLSVKFEDKVREETGTEWETLLDTAACIKPFFFTNHITGAQEIFIQDYHNNAYLINAAGRVLWKVALKERIIGNVYMIDLYGNKKYQLLFSGKANLHLLDRNGNYVERYPVKLRSPASAPLALFDYDNNNDYRLVIPGEDRFIYAYDKSGNVVKGWKPFRANGNVRSEVKFFRASGKDYLVASDDNTVYFLDRTGSIRMRVKEPVIRASHSEIRMNQGSDPALVFTDPDGTVQVVSFDGGVRKIFLRKFSVDHSFDYFDVDGDGFGEYIFIDKGILYLYEHDKSEVFTRDFGSGELAGPINFVFSALDRKIGVFDSKNKLIYLTDSRGNTMNGFPLRGESLFSIGKLSDKSGFHLIVGGSDSFLYNYKIDTGSR
jgi:hypothetical protein